MAGNLAAKFEAEPFESLRRMPLLERLPNDGVSALVRHCAWFHLQPGDRLSRKIDRRLEHAHYFIAAGQMGVMRTFASKDEDSVPLKIAGGIPQHNHEFLTYFLEGDAFSDEYLKSGAGLDCVATMETVLAAVTKSRLDALMRAHITWAVDLRARFETLRERWTVNRARSLPMIQDFYLRQNYSFATTLKVIDVDLCIECDGCERACADRHGVSRLERKGPLLGRLSFPISCRTCTDHRCLPACGFDALNKIEGELIIDPKKCVGCRACYEACPNGVINMIETAYTSADFPNPMPNTALDGATNVPGLYLVGEASGAALIKVAINGGVAAVQSIGKQLERRTVGSGVKDVVIVGAGPAGLGAALEAMAEGLDFVIFDKGHFAETIQSYPRQKLVMAEPAHIPKYGKLWLKNTTKEELIAKWAEVIQTTELKINSREPVTSVKRADDGLFDVVTSKGAYRAQSVVLAVGTRGNPRTLGVPGEDEERVAYTLTDPEPFAKKHVLVVGGGDSAVEAAMSLADFGATVTLSYRKDSFGRIKGGNRTRLDEYVAKLKVDVLLESKVLRLDPGTVAIGLKAGERVLKNDFTFAMLGGEPPTKFFKDAGVEILEPNTEAMAKLAESRGNRFYASKCDHCAGHSDQACIAACPTGAIFELEPKELFLEDVEEVRFREKPFVHGLSSRRARVAGLAVLIAVIATGLVGVECFLEAMAPNFSLLQRSLSAGEGLGFWLGVSGSSMMLLTALYPFHARLGWLRPVAQTRAWLFAHILAGLVGPAFVSFHTMLKLDRWPSIAFWAMWIVVCSGMLGRWFFTSARRENAVAELEVRAQAKKRRLGAQLFRLMERTGGFWRVFHIAMTIVLLVVASVHAVVALSYRAG